MQNNETEKKIPVVDEIRAGQGKGMGVGHKFLDTDLCFLMPDLKRNAAGNFYGREASSGFSKNFSFRYTEGS